MHPLRIFWFVIGLYHLPEKSPVYHSIISVTDYSDQNLYIELGTFCLFEGAVSAQPLPKC